MINIMQKNRGAISIFLVIVLVPMLTVASVFVDMSRLNLAKAVAESAGTLTLNTALTNYDAVLKDMYGLFATSQDTDELFENLENYYKQCIESAGVAEADAENYVDQIMQLLRSETGTDDLLNMNLTSFEVNKPTGGSLANPAVLKEQIVEFMKYRAPINLGIGIFEALSSMKNIKKQSELVDNKNKFYETQTGVLAKLEYAWCEIMDYQYRDAYIMGEGDDYTFPQGKYLFYSARRMTVYEDELKNALAYTVRYVYPAGTNYNTETNPMEGIGIDLVSSDDEAYSEIWTIKQASGVEPTSLGIEAEPEKTSLDDLKISLENAFRAIQTLEKDDEILTIFQQGDSVLSATEKIQIVAKSNETLNQYYHANMRNLMWTLVDLKNEYNGATELDLSSVYVIVEEDGAGNKSLNITDDPEAEGELIPIRSFINSQLNTHLNKENTYIKAYNGYMSRISRFWDETHEIVAAARKYVMDYAEIASHAAWAFDSFLEGKIKRLDKAMETLTWVKNQLTDPDSDYNKALSAWRNSANNLSDDTLGKNDVSEIAKLEKVLSVEKVEKLYTRLEGAKTSLNGVKDQVAKFKVLGKEWKDLKNHNNPNSKISYTVFSNLLSNDQKNRINAIGASANIGTETVSGVDAQFNREYDTIIGELKGTVLTATIKTEWASNELNKSPDLTKNQDGLYTWLYNNFFQDSKAESQFTRTSFDDYEPTDGVSATNEIDSNKKDAEASKTGMESAASKYINPSDDMAIKSGTKPEDRDYDRKFLPSGEWEELKKVALVPLPSAGQESNNSKQTLASAASGLDIFKDLFEAVSDMATTLRDDMYIANYIMNMFSYATYEAEITVANKNPYSAFESWYMWNDTDKKYELKSDFDTKYTNSAQMLKDARTLTKVSINPNANYLYGKEVEYIVYGDGSTDAVFGTIYMIRFALNTVYAFTDAEINSITTAAATAMFGVPPLTPLIPIAKIAMTIGLALAESAYDLYQLKCGEKIPLIKSSKTWVMKPSSALKAVAGEILEYATDKVIDAGVKVLNEALEMTDEELEKLINEGGEAFENLAKAATDATMNELRNYGNQAIQQMMSICNNVNMIVMEKTTYAKGQTQEKIDAAIVQLDEWLATQGSSDSDVIYLVKKTAVDYLKQESGKVIGELFDAIDQINVPDGQDAAQFLYNKMNDVQKIIDEKISELSNQAGNALNDLREQSMTKLKEAAKNGAESLRASLKEQIGATFGTSSSKEKGATAVVSSLLSWAYSDYLELFLLVAVIASPESVLLRTADIMELNMQQINKNFGYIDVTTETEVSRLLGLIKYTKTETTREANPEAFKLSKSYTYLNIKSKIEVKPLLMTLPLMGDTVESQLTGTDWYQIEYEGTMGY